MSSGSDHSSPAASEVTIVMGERTSRVPEEPGKLFSYTGQDSFPSSPISRGHGMTPGAFPSRRNTHTFGPNNSFTGGLTSRGSSIYAPSMGTSSGFAYADVPGGKYFKSRRIVKGENPLPPRKKQKGERLLWILPVCGMLLGLALSGLVIYFKLSQNSHFKYCPILDDDFSSGVLDTKVWTVEVESGGFGNHQFEQTTADSEVLFIKDGILTIKPKLQDESLLTANNVINLSGAGGCTATSDIWANCVSATNTTNGTIVPPVYSARINTKIGASIKYGRVEVVSKIAKGDWLWPAIWMLPVTDTYGEWPRSGEIDIMEARGNNYSYSLGGNNFGFSALHWGPNSDNDAYKYSINNKAAPHSEFGDEFHTFGLEWTEKYLLTYIDNVLLQAMYYKFDTPLWNKGNFPLSDSNGSVLTDPWAGTGRHDSPFDQEFYLIINLAVGGTNGWFLDGEDGKPWVDASDTARKDFYAAKDTWYPTWTKKGHGEMQVSSVKMWQQC